MSRRTLTVDRYKEIERLLAAGRGIREITRALKCSRRLVRQIRDGEQRSPEQPRSVVDPLWMAQVDWPGVIHDLGLGHPLKFLWEEKAQSLTTYSSFWKQLYRKFAQYRDAAITARDFEPGERVEVDYAGDSIEWVDLSTGEIRKAYVFVSGLGFSQLLFSWAAFQRRQRSAPSARAPIASNRAHRDTLLCSSTVARTTGSGADLTYCFVEVFPSFEA